MAKKNKKVKNEQEELELIDEELEEDDDIEDLPKKNKKGGCLVKFIILVIIIAMPVTLISLNVGNIRDKYLRPGLERIPIIKNLLPPLETDTENETENEVVDEKQHIIDSLTKEIEGLNDEITRLKEFEQNQLQFKAEKEEFDKMIALNDPKAYSTFYESIAPENAEELYKQAINKEVTDKKFKGYIQTFETMKKDAVATILEELIITDMDLVITILENVSSDKRSEILSAMDPKNAASCSKLLAPIQ
ncbi:hypothetical protein [uncultured Tyzzerella sp.]|uniref:MotE family protein n=1 Tax=uncultured Tyzzerella sp. TaxID=2321398 RepID=UPI002943E477|nr:hypothetical protein [uncultured Tyzzerella sp.]